ncbi:hypothetical protein K439DRAFT_1661929 [Ramaria rubella]|nr:hypothetical protein K439DRAFT_1661929 [Ramaria rubella]
MHVHRPTRTKSHLYPPVTAASRLRRSASVPRLALPAPSAVAVPPPRRRQPSFVLHPRRTRPPLPQHAPYPLSYHRHILACDALDHVTLKALCNSCSSIDYAHRPHPTRSLDLGCGPGAWIMEAANEWPHCKFVGFDLVDLQIPAHRLSPRYAGRIKWVHGNFLDPLPFEDGAFDHVHIRHIARGVPEDKWDFVLAEAARVLAVGGSLEMFEEGTPPALAPPHPRTTNPPSPDIIFPVLPRSSTATPHRHTATTLLPVQSPQGTRPPSSPGITKHLLPASHLEHDHAVLEALFYRVFERRFINTQPTALIMGTLDIHLRHAASSPLINFPSPPPRPSTTPSTPPPSQPPPTPPPPPSPPLLPLLHPPRHRPRSPRRRNPHLRVLLPHPHPTPPPPPPPRRRRRLARQHAPQLLPLPRIHLDPRHVHRRAQVRRPHRGFHGVFLQRGAGQRKRRCRAGQGGVRGAARGEARRHRRDVGAQSVSEASASVSVVRMRRRANHPLSFSAIHIYSLYAVGKASWHAAKPCGKSTNTRSTPTTSYSTSPTGHTSQTTPCSPSAKNSTPSWTATKPTWKPTTPSPTPSSPPSTGTLPAATPPKPTPPPNRSSRRCVAMRCAWSAPGSASCPRRVGCVAARGCL